MIIVEVGAPEIFHHQVYLVCSNAGIDSPVFDNRRMVECKESMENLFDLVDLLGFTMGHLQRINLITCKMSTTIDNRTRTFPKFLKYLIFHLENIFCFYDGGTFPSGLSFRIFDLRLLQIIYLDAGLNIKFHFDLISVSIHRSLSWTNFLVVSIIHIFWYYY